MAAENRSSLLRQESRMEQHRMNFESLKGEFLNLQKKHESLKEDYSNLSRNYDRVTMKSEEVIITVQEERDSKIMECEQLKTMIMTPAQLLDLKQEVFLKADNAYRKQLEDLEEELHVLGNDHKKICKNYDFLQTEHESMQISYENEMKEIKIRLQNELSEYRERCKDLSSRLERDIPSEMQRLRQLQRENTELSERNSVLLTENEELRSLIDSTDTSKEQHAFALSQQISELKGTLEQLSSDKMSLESQSKVLRNEIESQLQVNHSLTKQLLDCQSETKSWQRKYDDSLHKHSRDIDNIKRQNVQELQVYQDERKRHHEDLEQCRMETEMQEMAIKQLEASIADKDKELSAAVEKAVEVEWQRRVTIERERMTLEGQLAESQRTLLAQSEEFKKTVSEYKEQLLSLKSDKSLIESELESVRNELARKNTLCDQYSKGQVELKELKSKLSSLKHSKSSLEQSVKELEVENDTALTSNQSLSQQLHTMQSEMNQINERHERDMEKFRSELEDERASWSSRLEEMTTNKKKIEEKLVSVKKKRAKLQRDHQRSIQEVQRLLEVAHENEKQAMLEKDKMRKSANEDIRSLKSQLKIVRKQHRQFLMLINRSPETNPFATVDFDTELSTTTLAD